jgi:hypothetical protein
MTNRIKLNKENIVYGRTDHKAPEGGVKVKLYSFFILGVR